MKDHGFFLASLLVLQLPMFLATTGVDVSQPVSKSTWECLMTPGGQGAVEFAIVRVYQSSGHVDPHGATTIKAAHSAGVKNVDGYIFPCFSCSDAAGQVKATVEALKSTSFGMLWYDIERYRWSTSKEANQKFIKDMVDAGTSLGIHAGIYSSKNSWEAVVGQSWSYPSAQGLPIWYAHYDGSPAFSDFTGFGGWRSPSIKQYLGDKSSCGAGIDYNWYPSKSLPEHQPPLAHKASNLEHSKDEDPLLWSLTASPGWLQLSANSTDAQAPMRHVLDVVNSTAPSAADARTNATCGWISYKQCDSRWAQEPLGTSTSNTICRAGCAMSSVAMYLSTRGHTQTPESLNRWLVAHEGYVSNDLLVWGAVNSFGVRFQSMETGVSSATLQSGLAACHGIVANVRGGSHWVLLTGFAGGDSFTVNDPGFSQATYPLSEMLRFAVYH